MDCVDEITFLKRNKPVLKLGPALRKQLTHLSLCILGKTARQSQKSSTVLMKPLEQALSNVALVLLLCTWEYVTPAKGSSHQRSVCPREKNVNSRNRFIPLLQVLGDKQYRDGSCSRQHHIQTTQWWAQNKYQDCKIYLPSKEIQLWHERQTIVRKHQTQQLIILKDGLFAANGGHWNASFRDSRGISKCHKLQKTDIQDGQSLLLRATSKHHTSSFRKAEVEINFH